MQQNQERYFIEEQSLVTLTLSRLTNTFEFYADSNDEELFVDSTTGQKWVRYFFELDDEDVYGLRKLPYPTVEELLHLLVSSPYLDEVSGAVGLLCDLEYDDKTIREKIIEIIETNIDKVDAERFEIIYERADLYDGANKREILGKNYSEVQKDYSYYQSLAKRAESLKQIINKE